MAPPVEFLQESLLPVLERIGLGVKVELERHGFYPAGGGAIRALIQPGQGQAPLELVERGRAWGRRAEVLLANLSAHVARREAEALRHGLHWSPQEVEEREVRSPGPGNALVARLRFAQVTTVFTAFGEPRKPAERVATECADQVRRYLNTDAPVCDHLADQLLLPLALGRGGRFRAGKPSEHARTNAAIIAAFLGPVVDLADEGRGAWTVTVRGR